MLYYLGLSGFLSLFKEQFSFLHIHKAGECIEYFLYMKIYIHMSHTRRSAVVQDVLNTYRMIWRNLVLYIRILRRIKKRAFKNSLLND